MNETSIVLATDLSARCDRALDRALALAAERSASLVVVHAIPAPLPVDDQPSWRRGDPLAAARRKVAEDLAAPAEQQLDVVVERADPAELALRVAASRQCELIITGMARDEALGRVRLGATVEALAKRAPVPVLVVKTRPRDAYRHIVVATDFSDSSRAALETALALWPEARITLFHGFDVTYENYIVDKMAVRDAARRNALEQGEAFLQATPAAVATRTRIELVCEYGEPAALLGDLMTARGVRLVVLGTAGRSGLARMLVGSAALRIATAVPADVLLVRRAGP